MSEYSIKNGWVYLGPIETLSIYESIFKIKFFFLGFDKSENENVILLDYNTIDFNKYSDADLSNDLDLLMQ